jgi:3-hydroxybutyryl-CoA dehydrogenase
MHKAIMSPRIVIVGAGTMGVGIASVCARGGYRTALVETDALQRERLPALLRDVFSGDPGQPDAALVSIHAALPEVEWQGVELVIESVLEDLALKQRVFAQLEAVAPPACVLASNSSSFPISEIAGSLPSAHRMVNLHFFMPAHLVPGVEVVRGAASSLEAAQSAAAIMRRCFMVPVMVDRDLPGFLANRLQHALSREAYALIDAGIASPEAIDQAVRFCFGFRYLAAGPALQRDHSGLEIHAAAAARMYPSLATNAQPAQCLDSRVRRGRLGMKAGAGFYDWDAASAARERARYDAVLRAGLRLLAPELAAMREEDPAQQ